MQKFSYVIKDEVGIHARPAGLLVKEAKKYESKIQIIKDTKSADATKLMAVMGLGVKCGDMIIVEIEGSDEEAVCEKMKIFSLFFLSFLYSLSYILSITIPLTSKINERYMNSNTYPPFCESICQIKIIAFTGSELRHYSRRHAKYLLNLYRHNRMHKQSLLRMLYFQTR